MTRRCRALALAEALGSSLESTWWLTTSSSFRSRGLIPFPGLSGTNHAYGTQTDTQAKYSYVQNKQILKKLKSERIGHAKLKTWWARARRLEPV